MHVVESLRESRQGHGLSTIPHVLNAYDYPLFVLYIILWV